MIILSTSMQFFGLYLKEKWVKHVEQKLVRPIVSIGVLIVHYFFLVVLLPLGKSTTDLLCMYYE